MIQVEFIVYRFGEFATNPTHFYEVIYACANNALQPAKLPQ